MSELALNIPETLFPQIFPQQQVIPELPYAAARRCSRATAAALRAADLVRAGGGLISVPVALIASGANLRYAYLALGLSVSERELVEAGFESLGGILRRRREAYQATSAAPVTQSAVVELN